MMVSGLAIQSPIVEVLSNTYDCATGYCDPNLMMPGSSSLYSTSDDIFVSVAPSKFDSSIDNLGLLTSKGEEVEKRVWLTKFKYVDEVSDAREFESILYNQPISETKKANKFFSSGATIREVDIDSATPAGLTNMKNGIPQWFVTADIPPSKLRTIKR